MVGLWQAPALSVLAFVQVQLTGAKTRRPTKVFRTAKLAVPLLRTQFSSRFHTRVFTDLMRKTSDTTLHVSLNAASYIGAVVPSDHTPVPIRNISIGSGLPL